MRQSASILTGGVTSFNGATGDVVPVYTWALRPNAVGAGGRVIRISNIGSAGSMFISDGTNWLALNGHLTLGQSWLSASGANDTNENILASVTIPGGLMGPNGMLRITSMWSTATSVNTKTLRVRFGGIGGTIFQSSVVTAIVSTQNMTIISNKNSATSQSGYVAAAAAPFGSLGLAGALVSSSVDTGSDTTVVLTVQKDTAAVLASDAATLERYQVELITP